MRTTARVLGLTGGIIGVVAAILLSVIGALAAGAGDPEGGGLVFFLSFAGVLIGVAGIVGGALTNRSRTASWIVMLVAGMLGFIAVSAFWLLPGILLVAGAIFELAGGKTPRVADEPTQQQSRLTAN